MKTTHTRLIAAIAVALLVIPGQGCQKYPDGPGFSLASRTDRIQREWDAKEIVHSDGSSDFDTSNDYISFEEDDVFKYVSGSITVEGTWEFGSKKRTVRTTVTINNTVITEQAEIRRLTSEDLWLKGSDGDITKYKAK